MKIGFANKWDKDRIKNIWQYCFRDKEEFVDWFFNAKYCSDNTIVAYDDDIAMSNLQLIPYKICYKGEALNASYMVGVATMPEARGKGYVQGIISEALNIMNRRNELMSILLPFNYGFYRKYGWEVCYNHNSYKFAPSMLKPLVNNSSRYGNTRSIDFSDKNDIEILKDIYLKFTLDKNGYIIRSYEDWENILADMTIDKMKGYFIELNGIVEGYILFGIFDNNLNIHEIAFLNSEAYKALLEFVYLHSAQVDTVTWKAPADDITYMFLSEPRQAANISPFVMARVVDVIGVLEFLIKSIPKDFKFTIYVEDRLAKWNNGVFKIENGKVNKVNKINVDSINKSKDDTKYGSLENIDWEESLGYKPDIICNINTFTQLTMGYISVLTAYKIGLIDVKDSNSMDRANIIFKLENNYINDYY